MDLGSGIPRNPQVIANGPIAKVVGLALSLAAINAAYAYDGLLPLCEVALAVVYLDTRLFRSPYVQPIGSASLVCLVGLAPQLAFIIVYNDGLISQPHYADMVEPARLPALADAYERFIVRVWAFVDGRLQLKLWLAAPLALTFYGIEVACGSGLPSKALAAYLRWVGWLLLGLVAATSFTLVAPALSGPWTPNLPARITVLQRQDAEAEGSKAVVLGLIAQADQSKLLKSMVVLADQTARRASELSRAGPAGPCADHATSEAAALNFSTGVDPNVISCAIRLRGARSDHDETPALTDSDRETIALDDVSRKVMTLMDSLDPSPPRPSAPARSAPARPPTLDDVRALAGKTVSVRGLVNALRPHLVAAVSAVLPRPAVGSAVFAEWLGSVTDQMIDYLSEKLRDWGLAAVDRRGAVVGADALDAAGAALVSETFAAPPPPAWSASTADQIRDDIKSEAGRRESARMAKANRTRPDLEPGPRRAGGIDGVPAER